MIILKIAGGIVAAFLFLLIFSLCRISSRESRWEEEIDRRMNREVSDE